MQALARAACREETSTRSQGLGTHLLPEPVRNHHLLPPLMRKAAPIRLETYCPVIAAFCMFVFGLCSGGISPRLFLFNPSKLFVLTDHISEGTTLGNGIPLLPSALSRICHITLLRRRLDLRRKMKPCSQLQFADSHFKS